MTLGYLDRVIEDHRRKERCPMRTRILISSYSNIENIVMFKDGSRTKPNNDP